jgi:transposase
VAQRTQAICRCHRLLAELIPGGARRNLSAARAAKILDTIQPTDPVEATRKELALEYVADVRAVDQRIKQLERRMAEVVKATGTSLLSVYGIGPVIAALILGENGDVNRFATRHHFASYTGTAPIGASSGEQIRHRLNRAGNRNSTTRCT